MSLLALVVHGLQAQPVNDDFDEATVIPGGTASATFTGMMTEDNGSPVELRLFRLAQTPGYLRFRLDMRNPPTTGGRLEFVRQWPEGTIEWRHEGEPGYRYQIESKGASGPWQPLVLLDRATGTTSFRAPLSLSETAVFFRARGMD